MKISNKTLLSTQRFNSGSMRRYFHPSGAIIVTDTAHHKKAQVIPAWCHHISADRTRAQVLPLMLEIHAARRNVRASTPRR